MSSDQMQSDAAPRSRYRAAAAWLVIALFAFGLRVAAVTQYEAHHPQAEHPSIDEGAYDAWAREIAAGDWLGEEVFFQEPLYAYSLAVVYAASAGSRHAARIVQCALGALAAVLIGLLATRLFGFGAGLISGLAAALYSPSLAYSAFLLKPALVVPCLAALALVLLWRTDERGVLRWLGYGLLVGLGALLRGNVLILVPLLCAWPLVRSVVYKRERAAGLRASLLAAVGVALCLLPIAARNQYVGGVFALTTSGAGTNVYGGNNEQNPYGVATEFDWVRGIPEFEADDWRREAERRGGRELDPGEVSAYWLAETRASLASDPGLHASILWNKLRLALNAFEVPDNHYLPWDARYVAVLSWPTGGFACWGLLGLAGVLVTLFPRSPYRRKLESAWPRGPQLELALLCAAYIGTIVLTVMSARIRLALVPFLLPFVGAFALRTLALVRKDNRTRMSDALSLIPALGIAALCALWPVFDAARHTEELAERDFNLAVQCAAEGEWDAALELARTLDQSYPGTSRVQTLIASGEFEAGRRAVQAGDTASGREQMQAALARVAPLLEVAGIARRERFRAAKLAGSIASVLGEWSRAEGYLRAARGFDDEDPELLIELCDVVLRDRATQLSTTVPDARLDELLATVQLAAEVRGASAELRITWSRVQAQRALEHLRVAGVSGSERARLQDEVRDALVHLRRVSEQLGLTPDVLYAARLAAATIQLDPLLANYTAAQNHARAALEMRPAAYEPRRILALSQLQLANDATGRTQALAALRALAQEADDVALASFADEFERTHSE